MSESTTIVVSGIGTGVGIIGVLSLMLRILATTIAREFNATKKWIDELKSDLNNRIEDTSRSVI